MTDVVCRQDLAVQKYRSGPFAKCDYDMYITTHLLTSGSIQTNTQDNWPGYDYVWGKPDVRRVRMHTIGIRVLEVYGV